MKLNTFQAGLADLIRRRIINLKREGTMAIGADCLWQLIASDVSRLAGAPVGTNGAYYAKQDFNQICSSCFSRFVVEVK